jgi:hypothetical protein
LDRDGTGDGLPDDGDALGETDGDGPVDSAGVGGSVGAGAGPNGAFSGQYGYPMLRVCRTSPVTGSEHHALPS